jgi:hypothetical protein
MPISASIAQCTHIKLSGYRCGSPALAGQQLCYYHARLRRGAKARLDAAIPPLLLLEDAESIQGALMQITDMLLYDQIQEKKAGLILRAIGLALRNVKNLQHDAPAGTPSGFDHKMVTELPAGDPAAAPPEGEVNGDTNKDGSQPAQPESGAGSAVSSNGLPESILPEADKRPFRRYCEAEVRCGWEESEEVYVTQLGRMDRALSAVESRIKTAALAGKPASSLVPALAGKPSSPPVPEALPSSAEQSSSPAPAIAAAEPHFIAPAPQTVDYRTVTEPPPMTPLELAEKINSIRERASEDWRKTHSEK